MVHILWLTSAEVLRVEGDLLRTCIACADSSLKPDKPKLSKVPEFENVSHIPHDGTMVRVHNPMGIGNSLVIVSGHENLLGSIPS